MEIINPDEEPLDWDKGGKKRRPDHNPWHPHKDEKQDPFPYPHPGDPLDDPWPGRRKKEDDYRHRRKDPHRKFEPPGKKTCPGCGGSGEVDHPPYPPTPWHGEPDHNYPTEDYHDYPTGPTEWTHRGQQSGRKGHFGSGHQKEDQWGRPDKSPPPTKWSGQPGINSPNPHHPLDMHPNHPDYHDQTFEERKKYGGDINNNPNFIMVTGDRSHIRKTPHDPNAQPTY